MHHQQYGFANPTDRMPALLAIDDAAFAEYKIWVGENPRCRLKIYATVLLLVRTVLFRIPFKVPRVIHNV